MLLAVLMTICAATVDGKACDVRVKYIHTAQSEVACVTEANAIMNDNVEAMRSKEPSFYLLSKSADCHSFERIKALLNVIPDVMHEQGYTYRMSFY